MRATSSSHSRALEAVRHTHCSHEPAPVARQLYRNTGGRLGVGMTCKVSVEIRICTYERCIDLKARRSQTVCLNSMLQLLNSWENLYGSCLKKKTQRFQNLLYNVT